MNIYKLSGEFTKFSSAFFSKLGFKNIESISKNNIYKRFELKMKDGLTAHINFGKPGVRGVYWSIRDFEIQAKKNWELSVSPETNHTNTAWQDMYDESKFEKALDLMINDHDASLGISWETVSFWLNEICLKK